MSRIIRSAETVSAEPVAVADEVMLFAPASDAEALKLLHASFPDRPLSARLAALVFLMKRQGGRYTPR